MALATGGSHGIARFCAADGALAYLVCAGIIETGQWREFVEHYGMAAALGIIALIGDSYYLISLVGCVGSLCSAIK